MSQSTLPHVRWNVCAGAVLATALIGCSSVASAQGYRPREAYGRPGYVIAESQWGNGTITGAVRQGRRGLQVRMPRGTWIDCVRSCSDTLRRETIDFWETHGPNAPGSGRGYLNWEFRF